MEVNGIELKINMCVVLNGEHEVIYYIKDIDEDHGRIKVTRNEPSSEYASSPYPIYSFGYWGWSSTIDESEKWVYAVNVAQVLNSSKSSGISSFHPNCYCDSLALAWSGHDKDCSWWKERLNTKNKNRG